MYLVMHHFQKANIKISFHHSQQFGIVRETFLNTVLGSVGENRQTTRTSLLHVGAFMHLLLK